MADISRLLNSLENVKRTGADRWMARCPAHPDKTPSLSIRSTEDGRILMHCFGGCAVDSVASAIGLALADLMPDRAPFEGKKPVKSKIPASDLLAFIGFEATIVQLAAFDIATGKALSEVDILRLKLAYERLDDAVRECRR